MGNDTKSDNRLIEDRIFEKTGMLIEALPSCGAILTRRW
jgi:geranylgeranyl pyrophosphate synthase